MKFSVRLLFLVLPPAAVLLSGCEKVDHEAEAAAAAAENARLAKEWDPSWGPNPYLDGANGTTVGPNGEEEVIRDSAYVVVEKRQSGGDLVPSGKSNFDGRTLYSRTPVESMIIVEGNRTGQRSAYLLPQADYNVVQVGHALQESTLTRWESTSQDHIKPSEPRPVRQRSRSGGAAENYHY